MLQWNAKVLFPADSDYSNRVLKAKYGPSNSSGNPMITLEMEVVSPQSKEIGGVQYNIAGCKTTNYYSINGYDEDGEIDTDKTKNAREKIKNLYELFGLTPPTNFDEPLDVKGFEKKVVLTQMNSKIVEMRKTPTAEQAAKKQQGDIQKHPVTGKPLIQYWPQVQEIFGLAPEGMSAVAREKQKDIDMPKYHIKYTITGEYDICENEAADILCDLEEDASAQEKLDCIKSAVKEFPFETTNPVSDGKVTTEVAEVTE